MRLLCGQSASVEGVVYKLILLNMHIHCPPVYCPYTLPNALGENLFGLVELGRVFHKVGNVETEVETER